MREGEVRHDAMSLRFGEKNTEQFIRVVQSFSWIMIFVY